MSEFPRLSSAFPIAWIEANAGNYDIFWWHPVYSPDVPAVADYLRRLELALDYLSHPEGSGTPVEGLADVISQLRDARSLGDFTSHRDEILLGAPLRRQYKDFAFGGKSAGADIRIHLDDGSCLEVELTTTEKMRDLERLVVAASLARLEADRESRFTCFVRYEDETSPIKSDTVGELAAQVYVEIGESYDQGDDAPETLAAEIAGETCRVDMHRGPVGSGMVMPLRMFGGEDAAGFIALADFFKAGPDAVWNKIQDEMGQLTGDHNVVAVNVARQSDLANLLRDEQLRDALQWLSDEEQIQYGLDSRYLPERLDLAVVFWLDWYGHYHGEPVEVRSRDRVWAKTDQAENFLAVLRQQP